MKGASTNSMPFRPISNIRKWWNIFLVRAHCHCHRFSSQRSGSSPVCCIFPYNGVPEPVSGKLANSSCCTYRRPAIIFGGQIDLLSLWNACRTLGIVQFFFLLSSMWLRRLMLNMCNWKLHTMLLLAPMIVLCYSIWTTLHVYIIYRWRGTTKKKQKKNGFEIVKHNNSLACEVWLRFDESYAHFWVGTYTTTSNEHNF